jgi:hypothetical protein
LALLLPLGVWAWSGTGHFVLESIGYTDGTHARAYTVAPNFRQASGSLNQANSAISSDDAADVYVNFNYSTSGKNIWVVYTTDGTAPNKGNGTPVAAAFSKYADSNSTWYATIPAQAVGTTVNYVFYISDSNLASASGRISGAEADRNLSQYETSWGEDDGDYFTYGVCGKAITVTSAADDDAGSLRRAIVNACPGATVSFSDTLAGQTITLTSGELHINKLLTVDSGSQAITVSGNTTSHVFDIGASGVVTLSHLSIVSGTNSNVVVEDGSVGGGGIHNKGTLTVQDCALSGNVSTGGGGGIYNQGALTVQDCVLSDNESADNGGGISNYEGVLTVQNSVLSGNQSGKGGGGIGNGGSGSPSGLTLRDSTLSGNSAIYGGGLFNSNNGQITVHNSTLSGNAATGTGDYDGGGAIDQGIGSVSATISNSTLVSNTAASPNQTTSGIWLEAGALTLHNSIVADNNGTNNFQQDGGTFTSQGYNLSNAWNGMTTQSTDLIGDPLLGALADNGGETRTHALLPGSPAIDAGDPASYPDTDQRGITRPQVGGCDIGAVESQGFTLTYNSGSGQSTLPGTAFANPLALTVSSSAGEPVNGGLMVFTGPASGAALSSSPLTVTISGGTASQMVTANGIGGSYVVTATTRGGLNSISYSLTNTVPEITVIGNGQVIADGDASPSTADHTDFGSVGLEQTRTRTFTISNDGSATLALTGTPAVSLSGADAFSVVAQPATSVEPSASVTFQVRFTPSVTGAQSATVTIANNDSDEAPYDFVIEGMGTTNQAPAANAGSDQSVSVGGVVTLDGSASTDPDGHTPLSYGWTQTGGPAVTLSNAAAASPTFTAPGTPTVLTFTLSVTDSFGLPALVSDAVSIIVNDVPVSGLAVTTNSPTTIGQITTFTATAQGSNLVYTWNFGDGSPVISGSSPTITHTYPAIAATYTAVVTATNGSNSQQVSFSVQIRSSEVYIYLPLVQNAYTNASGLGVAQLPTTAPADKGIARSR